MRIESIRTERFSLPLLAPFQTSAGLVERRDLSLFRITVEDGHVGTGEVTPLPQLDGITVSQAASALNDPMVQSLFGMQVEETATLLPELRERLPRCSFAALETALLDLEARMLGLKLADLIAPEHDDSILVNAVIAAESADDIAAAGKRVVEGGYETVKLKVGFPNDVWRVSALRDAVGYGVRIRLDANGAWWGAEAVQKIGDLTEFGIELIEQPVKADDLVGMHNVRETFNVPIVADEGVRTVADVQRHVEEAACDGIAIKLAPTGGLTAAREMAELAAKGGLFTIVTSALDGPVGLATGVHFASTVADNDLAHGLATAELLDPSIVPDWLHAAEGRIRLPDLPGHGVDYSTG
jgi:o-succinylbenzoate synthase